MVGSAIVRQLEKKGYTNIITRTHKELNLCRQNEVEDFFAKEKPEYVFLAAAKVGGIAANEEALADFMYDNMILEMNVIHAAWQNGCKKLEFLGSSCIYPRMAPQPMKESCLLTSELEKTNEAYALAKISGLKYCEFLNRQYGTDYISVMPTNLYGPNDNYHPTHSHVLPALIRRFHEAKERGELTLWRESWRENMACAKDIRDKYLNPPRTTDFAVLFLPIEGLFAEVIRRPGLTESMQRDFRIVIAGPTTLWSILNSLQMGFRTLAIQKRSSEVWNLLGAVKTEWGKYGEILDVVQKKIHQASETIEKAKVRTRVIGRKLQNVQELPVADSSILLSLPIEEEDEDALPESTLI